MYMHQTKYASDVDTGKGVYAKVYRRRVNEWHCAYKDVKGEEGIKAFPNRALAALFAAEVIADAPA